MKKHYEYIAKTFSGLEEVLKQELLELGAENIQVHKRAVSYSGDLELLYKSNLWLRTAIKILMPIFDFSAKNEEEFYQKVKRFGWEKHLTANHTFAIDCVIGKSDYFNHNHFMALKAKDAIVDRFTERYNARPSIDVKHPELRIHVHINQGQCSVSLDSSGETLNKRGYRARTDIAPLNEVLAAGMILLSGWDKEQPFFDPMCGSGTILIEAAMIAMDKAPGLDRKEFAFELWNDFDAELFDKVIAEAEQKIHPPVNDIIGNDNYRRAVSVAKQNTINAGLQKHIKVANRAFQEFDPPEKVFFIITNPPYGERIKVNDLETLYKELGDTLKQKYQGADAWILSSNTDAVKRIGLRPSKKIRLFNGALECRFLKYEMYAGSKKRQDIDE